MILDVLFISTLTKQVSHSFLEKHAKLLKRCTHAEGKRLTG